MQEPTQVLVKDLNLVLKEGEHLMITGSNGVGKTAVARVLAVFGQAKDRIHRFLDHLNSYGRIKRQTTTCVVVVPQRAYMVTGPFSPK